MTRNSLLQLPGLWIDDADRDWAYTIVSLLRFVANQFNEAVVAFDLFDKRPSLQTLMARRSSSGEIDNRNRILVFMHAKSFVYALDSTRAFLSVVANQPRLPASASNAIQDFQNQKLIKLF